MDYALREAALAASQEEVPIGAILVVDGNIYSKGGNRREATNNPMGHAELLAIEHASEMLQNWRVLNSTLYVTVEPCLMCTGAIYLSRITRVVYGCKNPKGGALQHVCENEKQFNLNHHVEVTSGIKEAECAKLLKDFFGNLRKLRLL